jgi:hypothetical protein
MYSLLAKVHMGLLIWMLLVYYTNFFHPFVSICITVLVLTSEYENRSLPTGSIKMYLPTVAGGLEINSLNDIMYSPLAQVGKLLAILTKLCTLSWNGWASTVVDNLDNTVYSPPFQVDQGSTIQKPKCTQSWHRLARG